MTASSIYRPGRVAKLRREGRAPTSEGVLQSLHDGSSDPLIYCVAPFRDCDCHRPFLVLTALSAADPTHVPTHLCQSELLAPHPEGLLSSLRVCNCFHLNQAKSALCTRFLSRVMRQLGVRRPLFVQVKVMQEPVDDRQDQNT